MSQAIHLREFAKVTVRQPMYANAMKPALIFLFILMLGCGSKQNPGDVEDAGLFGQDATGDTHADATADTTPPPDTDDADSDTAPANPNDRPSGEVDEVRQGDPLEVDEARRLAARTAYEQLDKDELEAGFEPEALYATFNEFALTHFGPANQPLLHKYTGEVLDFVTRGDWRHISVNSATIAFESTLPVRGSLEYGTRADALSETTPESERYYFTQIHHLRGLEPETTYYYRLVARGTSGETIVSKVREFKTGGLGALTELPGTLEGPPYILDQPGTTYLLSEDIVADGTAIHIAASDITVDLNGHRIIYANSAQPNPDPSQAETAASGVWARSSEVTGVRVVNGFIDEGFVGNAGDEGLHAVYLSGVEGIELAGLSISYHAAQVFAVYLRYPAGRVHLHHNNFADRGFEILNRHGSGGGRPLNISDTNTQAAIANDYELNHNLVKRTRQNGLRQANSIHDNEIYVDSWSTNSFAIQPHSTPDTPGGDVHRNKIFLSGYHSIALGWAHLDLSVDENLVQLEGVSTQNRRYFEDWGDMDSLNGFRITNYGSGGQVRDNLTYRNNVIVGRARSGGIMRGTELFSDATITNTRFEDNFVHISAEDAETLDAAPVVTQGVSGTRADHEPTYYVHNRLISNIANVRFGDSYGRGNRHTFIDTTFVKFGEHPDYHTFIFDGAYDSYDHELIDPVFEGGPAVDDVWWRRISVRAYYTVKWTLSLQGEPGASVVIRDVDDAQVFSGTLGEDGTLEVPLAQMTIRPADWADDGAGGEVRDKLNHQKIMHTPHTVEVAGQTQSVSVDGLGKALMF